MLNTSILPYSLNTCASTFLNNPLKPHQKIYIEYYTSEGRPFYLDFQKKTTSWDKPESDSENDEEKPLIITS